MTAIVQLSRGFETWAWLCDPHIADRVADGWEVVQRKPAPYPIPCDDCRTAPPSISPPTRRQDTRSAGKVGTAPAGRKVRSTL